MPSLDFSGAIPSKIQLKKVDFQRIFDNCLTDLARLGQRDGRIELIFVDDAQSRALNQRYAGNDYPTDVLSFDYDEGQVVATLSQEQAIGLIAIDYDQLLRQSLAYDVLPHDEAVLLFVHGLLHLAGYDHQTTTQQAGFSARQNDMIERNEFKIRDFSWSH